MPFEINSQNIAALMPLFKPWEEPTYHRIPNAKSGGPAVVQPGRRPSKAPLVRGIRAEVDGWRRGGYGGASETSKTLLNHWFQNQHQVTGEDGSTIEFRYHWAQREAIETIIYLYEVRKIRSTAELMFEFGGEEIADLALGIDPATDRWPKDCCKMATGSGKTKVMSLAIVWSYFHRLFEPESDLAQHFVLIAPNLTVNDRLRVDFENCAIFFQDPLIPEEWLSDFQMQVVLQDEPGGGASTGAIYLTNIHRLYESRDRENTTDWDLFGPSVQRAQALDTSEALRQRITRHPRLMVLNDEAHHLHDPELEWNKAIDSLHSQSLSNGMGGIRLQLDFTATPKHTDGQLFNHIMCDFPLGEAVDAGIVKVPVIGESDQLTVLGDNHTPAPDRYPNHLKIGYLRYEQSYDEWNRVRKPILFVMTENAEAANEISNFLDSDDFPLLKGKVLNIHTKLKGRIKSVRRGGREIKEFVESETGMKPDDLQALREMSRELDRQDSKFRCVVSVMMLREGWDVRNVTTIIPLRAYTADSGILPEQTLGRGLRRMIPLGEVPEVVTVVHHPAFRRLYEEELAQEGLDIAVLPIRQTLKETVTIFVDREHKDVESLDIEIPIVSDAIETTRELSGLDDKDIKDYFDQHFHPLPVGRKREGMVEYKERQLFTDEIVTTMTLEAGLLEHAWSAASYFAQEIGRICRISNPHKILTPMIESFISKVLFEKDVDLYGGEVDHRMQDADVLEHTRATFTPLILERTVQKVARKQSEVKKALSTWKDFQASSTEKRPAVQATKTMFNLVPCDNEFERSFTDFCDFAADIFAFAKNAGPQKLMIDYLRPDGHRALYVPDFFVRSNSGKYYLCEMKGREDALVPIKARAAVEWCKTASKGGMEWEYVFIPYQLFQQNAGNTIEELGRACRPSLANLITEAKSAQMALPLEESAAEAAAEDLVSRMFREAGLDEPPDSAKDAMRQSILLLDHADKTGMPNLGHAFQPMLAPLDYYAIKMLEKYIKPCIPTTTQRQIDYFSPYLDQLEHRERMALERNGRYLKENMVFGRSIQKLGTLLFCLNYARERGYGASGVWEDVVRIFSSEAMQTLYADLEQVNNLRNTRIAHIEEPLTDKEMAWREMKVWLRCLDKMAEICGE